MRHDVQLLVDSGVIDLPVSAWPIAASDLANALGSIAEATSRAPGLGARGPGSGLRDFQAPLLRRPARRRRAPAFPGQRRQTPPSASKSARPPRPTQLRTFADTPREEGEVSLYASQLSSAHATAAACR
ncbi:MAG: hypothetical protein V9F00_15710 [Nocardioides sp.]